MFLCPFENFKCLTVTSSYDTEDDNIFSSDLQAEKWTILFSLFYPSPVENAEDFLFSVAFLWFLLKNGKEYQIFVSYADVFNQNLTVL